ncbi:hypothetical protein BDR03DRAFT_1043632 [Suillus americanus]|nr:hypothetical protein BDR03DRAFT_1043632 [Suillus americanus]
MMVGMMNHTNKAYISHFHVPLKNHVSRPLDLTADAVLSDNTKRTGWVNSNDYEQTRKTFGMIQFSPAFFKPLRMMEFNSTFACKQRLPHQFVAELQDPAQQPNWVSLTVIWAGHADGWRIFYKLSEHLKVYYKTWTDFCNEHNTVALNVEASQRIRALVRSIPMNIPINAPTAVPTTLRDSLTICPSVDITEVSSWQIGKILADHTLQQSAVHYPYANAVQAQATVAGPS